MRLIMITTVVCFSGSGLSAGEISVYQDDDGVINLTDRPVPSGTRVQHVIRYNEKSAAELERQKVSDDQKQRGAELERDVQNAQALHEAAAQAREEADKENALAREKTEAANKYLERYRQKKRSLRRRHRHEAKRIARDAEEAQARANAAIERANQAEEAARKGMTVQSGK